MKINKNINLEKKIIRKKIQEARNQLSLKEHELKSRIITKKLLKTGEYKSSQTIFIYYPFRSEIDTKGIIKDALKKGKKIIMPKIAGSQLKVFYVSNLKNDLKTGSFGIMEPDVLKCGEAKFDEIDLAIVPGLCFDLNFNRIGYGGGYYDKISEMLRKDVKKIALAFDLQMVKNVPCCPYDKKINIIITESQIYKDLKIYDK
ncbi:MAG: 5-formyltetrahydrofolate cyclo-ligase [Actinobacteria bacterium]|nr:5-formyltetrahydrofolate cyclo-ligase [Cyanobacteriota bacterium]MCL6088267.1 5-formyltetrahydrofolate cyclo-ligase [Actinomycetota bacterium]